MAKYYVESGTLRMVVQADDARKAALWAVHRALAQVLPVYEDESLTAEARFERVIEHGCMVLGETLELSEIGFGRCDVERFETGDVVTEWNQLLIALTRLEAELSGATASADG